MEMTLEPWHEIHTSMGRKEILAHMNEHGVRFLRLQFTDITGINKNVEVPASQFEKALDGEIMFDGSSIEGFTRIEESDMLPDPETRRTDWGTRRWWVNSKGARMNLMLSSAWAAAVRTAS